MFIKLNKDERGYQLPLLSSRIEAEALLETMQTFINLLGCVYVNDLIDIVGVIEEYKYGKYGWTNLDGAKVIKVGRVGYSVMLTKPDIIK